MAYRRTERSERVRTASRTRFLTAARELFRRHGFEKTTIQQIVREAASSVGNLYFYFRNKEALLHAVVADAFETIWGLAEGAMALVDRGPEKLVALTHVNVLAAYENPDLAQLVLSDQYPSLVELIETVQEPRFRAVLAENIESIGDTDLELAVATWAGAARNAMLKKLKSDLEISPADLTRFIARWNLRALDVPSDEIESAMGAIDVLNSRGMAALLSAIPTSSPRRTD